MRSVVIALSLFAAMQAHADSSGTSCFMLAKAGERIAVERDSGISKIKAIPKINAYVLLELDTQLDDVVITRMVDVVYDAPDVTVPEVYSRVLEQCIAFTAPLKNVADGQ